jgi:hypothetical protein
VILYDHVCKDSHKASKVIGTGTDKRNIKMFLEQQPIVSVMGINQPMDTAPRNWTRGLIPLTGYIEVTYF